MKTTISLTSFICLFCIIIAVRPAAMAMMKFAGQRHALLIGINKYKNVKSLRGCENDVRLVADFLKQRDFKNDHIQTLLGNQATKVGIVNALTTLISNVGAGDVVLIHFSGHGSQVADDNSEEIDHWDETLIPYDYINNKKNSRRTAVTDDELDSLLTLLGTKTNNVTVILDACHSGGAARFIKLNTEKNAVYSAERFLIPVDSPAVVEFQDGAGAEELLMDRSDFGKTDAKYVLVTGCRSDETSKETGLGGKVHGILTYSLVNELLTAEGLLLWPDVMANVRQHVRMYNLYQSPQLSGDHADSYIFGDNVRVNKQFILASPTTGGMVLIEAGTILGITRGSTFKVFPPGTTDFDRVAPIAEIEITDVGPSSSNAKVLKGQVTQNNCKARELQHNYVASQLRINFTGSWQTPVLRSLKSAVMSVPHVKEEKTLPQLMATAIGNNVELSFPNDTLVLNRFNTDMPNLQSTIVEKIKQWQMWLHVLNISNPASKTRIAVELKPTTVRDLSQDIVSQPDYVFQHGEDVQLIIKNLSRTDVFINILDLQDDAQIKAYTLGDFRNTPSNDKLAPADEVSIIFPLRAREGSATTLDVMKIFSTTEDMRFNFLESMQDAISNDDNKAARDFGPEARKIGLNGWTTVEKVILIKR